LIAIRTIVAGKALNWLGVPVGFRTTLVRWREHSGQRIPTGVGVMHSGQIGLPQLEQETAVSRLGWR
jgi:hypothetical protein